MSEVIRNNLPVNKENETATKEENNNKEESTTEKEETIEELPLGEKQQEVEEDVLTKIIEHFPKRMRTRARLIGGYLKNGEKPIRWNKKGEILNGGLPVPGSSIQDLLYDTTCIKRKYIPTGAKIFYKQLYENNIPAGLVMNHNRRNLMKNKQTFPSLHRKYKDIKTAAWVHY